jgi:GNAT superfamily N-acetyltransferase
MPVTIREFLKTDRAVLQDIFLQSRVVAFNWLDTSLYQLTDFDEATAGEKILVAEYCGVVRGFASIWMADNFIHHLYVNPLFMNRGIGSSLLNEAIKTVPARPTLKCMAKNYIALKFYESHGWCRVSEDLNPDSSYYLLMGKPKK